jgi:major vault protein
MPEIQGQLVLAQNQYAFIQDATKGTVQVYAGPHVLALSGNDRPVTYVKETDTFVQVQLTEAIKQTPLVPEGHYLVLENPATDNKKELTFPKSGGNSPIGLEVGRKINILGPATFPLWPGQVAQAIPGHHLRSNQYLVVRVYNAEQANKNRPEFLKPANAEDLTPGQQIVIKGTDVSFFIPQTGFEVLQDNGTYVREALTLELLEYCILLDEDGKKRYERGPQVVFPEATERFVKKSEGADDNQRGTFKFKAIELNDQMGLYIKVIADYTDEDGTEHDTGDELFITGKEQRIYYPRPEHALIEYDDPSKGYKRQRYYGVTIPKGEGRFVLDKAAGQIKKVTGPQIFLPDPRNQVIVRRVLDDRTVRLWYPGNEEAAAFNQQLRQLTENSASYLAEAALLSAAADVSRSINRGTAGSKGYGGDTMRRGTSFTPPPMLTLNTKYDGVPSVNVWTGWAVQVVDKSGNRRVVVGPATVLLEYDESLEIIELSTGKPKNTDNLIRDVYLRVDNNLVSDIVRIETKDLVHVDLRLSYRVNFLREQQDKWFSVQNYVKYLCDHMRSLLKGQLKKQGIKEVTQDAATLVRDIVLGSKEEGKKRVRLFEENGMEVYDVEVLGVTISDAAIANLLTDGQIKAVEATIMLSMDEQRLENTRRSTIIQTEVAELETKAKMVKEHLTRELASAAAETALFRLEAEIKQAIRQRDFEIEAEEKKDQIAASVFARRKTDNDYDIGLEGQRVAFFEKRMAAIGPDLVAAMNTLGQTEFATKLATAIAPLAINEQQGLGTTLERIFKGTALETVLANVQSKGKSLPLPK